MKLLANYLSELARVLLAPTRARWMESVLWKPFKINMSEKNDDLAS